MPESGGKLHFSRCNPAAKEGEMLEAAVNESGELRGKQEKKLNTHGRRGSRGRGALLFALALVAGLGLALLLGLPVGPTSQLIPVAQAHAILLRSDPPANALLRSSPAHVYLWFDDDLVPATSRVVVEDAAGHEVDRRDSQVSRSNPREMTVTLPRLPGGTYTVVWVAQSSDDAHVTEGSFTFRVAGPNGTVPPATGQQTGSSTPALESVSLDGPVIVQALATWLALLGMAYWLGGLIWETWVLPPGAQGDPDLRAASRTAARRFRKLLPYLLGMLLLANVGIVLAQEAELAGSWSGAFTPSLLQAILFGSRFGFFWWMREVTVAAALVLTLLVTRRGASSRSIVQVTAEDAGHGAVVVPTPKARSGWGRAVLETMRRVPYLPARLVKGWRACSWPARLELLLAASLLVAFAFSGHAAAVPNSEQGYAVSVDVLHLLGMAAWVGGLLYISIVLMPTLHRLNPRQYAHMLTQGVPEFSALAITSAVVLAATGSLNTSVHLTSLVQFLTTLYGWILAIKIEFFLLMALISAYHAFSLRPRLARTLTGQSEREGDALKQALVTVSPGRTMRADTPAQQEKAKGQGNQGDREEVYEQSQRLAERMEDWLRREAMLGILVLLCVALLSIFAGTLTP